MYVHRSVGPVTFVTCDLVLGAEGTASELDALVRKLKPATVCVDLTAEDLARIGHAPPKDPYLTLMADTVAPVEQEPALRGYERLLGWVAEEEADLRPIAPPSRLGMLNRRRMERAVGKVEAATPEKLLRKAMEVLHADEQLAQLVEGRVEDVTRALVNVLETEPPRTVAVFTFPWGERVSADVRRQLKLRRLEDASFDGGWPE